MELEEVKPTPSKIIGDPENDEKLRDLLREQLDDIHFWFDQDRRPEDLKNAKNIHLAIENDKIIYWVEGQKDKDEYGLPKHHELPKNFSPYEDVRKEIQKSETEDQPDGSRFLDNQDLKINLILCIKRDIASRYIAACKQPVQDTSDSKPLPIVQVFYREDEYTPEKMKKEGITPAEYLPRCLLSSTQGGFKVITDFDIDQTRLPGQNTNPLGVDTCPDHNVLIALDCELTGYGGYFDQQENQYPTPKEAAVVVANGYEFETFSAKAFRDGDCPFISTKPSKQFSHKLETVVLASSDNERTWNIKSTKSVGKNEEKQSLYFDQKGFQDYVRDKVIQQLQAITEAHKASGKAGGIEVNLSLGGLGFFANLNAKPDCSIAPDIAEAVAQGYRAAIAVIGEQSHSDNEPYIAGMRFTYSNDPRFVHEKNALTKVFGVEQGLVSGITVTQTTNPIEYIDDAKNEVNQAIILCADPRALPGNEQKAQSQEPGVFRWIKNGRQIFNPLFNPSILENVKKIDLTDAQRQSINQQEGQKKPEDDTVRDMTGLEIGVRLGIGLALGAAVGVALGFLTFGIAPLVIAGIAAAVFLASVAIPIVIEIVAVKINASTEADKQEIKEKEDFDPLPSYEDGSLILQTKSTKSENVQEPINIIQKTPEETPEEKNHTTPGFHT